MVDAIQFAVHAHRGQMRKGFQCPFIAHPLSVAANVMEYAGDDLDSPIVQAALLHDVLEDTPVGEQAIEMRYGVHVLNIVKAVTHDPLLKGREKRNAYVEVMRETPLIEAVIVSACDKLDNLRSIRHNQMVGTAGEFKSNMWFYDDLIDVYFTRLCYYPELVRAVVEARNIVMANFARNEASDVSVCE